MKTFDKWGMAYHRILIAKDNAAKGQPGCCDCVDCQEYMGQLGMDTDGKELRREAMQESQ
jgi:hypothetical protein